MAFKVEIDKEKCIGCGSCASTCAENFELADGKAKIKKSKVKEVSCNKEAEDVCPVNAIKVTQL